MRLLDSIRADRWLLTPVLIVAATVPTGCGEDDERPTYVIPAETAAPDVRVDSLDDDQLRDICASYSTFVETEVSFDALSDAVCLASAILTSVTEEGCEAAYDECVLRAPEALQLQARVEGDAACTSSLRGCDATVAEVEGCVGVRLDGLLAILDRLACGGADSEMRETAADLMGGLSACADVEAQCTDFTQTAVLQ